MFDSPLNTFFEQFSSVDVKVDKKLLTVLFPDGRDGRAFTLKVLLLLFLECFIFSFLFSPIYSELKFRCVELLADCEIIHAFGSFTFRI